MTRKTAIAFITATFMALRLGAAVTVTSGFDPATVEPGEHASYVITVNGNYSGSLEASIPEVGDLTIGSSAATSSRVQIVNGSVSSSIQYSYPCYATKEGTYTVPSFSAKIDGGAITVPAAVLTVTKSSVSATDNGGEDAMLVDVTAPETLYVGQSAPASVRFMIRNDLRSIHRLINPPVPISDDGIFQEPFDNNLVSNERIMRGTTAYNTVLAKTVVTAISAGEHKYGYDASAEVAAPNKKMGRISAFNDPLEEMMRNMQMHQDLLDEATDKIITISGHGEKTITVKPLPPDAPKEFDGAIGTFTLKSDIDKHETKVGEPVEISVVLTTPDGLKKLAAPAIDKSGDWRSYPPTEEGKATDALGLAGSKTFKYLLSPMKAGELKTPTIRFAYLDPSSGTYGELTVDPETVTVAEVPGMKREAEKDTHARSDNPFAADMHPIALLDTPASTDALLPPQKRKLFMWVQLVPAVLLAWAIIVPWRRHRASLDPMAVVRKKNGKTFSAARNKAAQAARKNDMDGFFSNASRCLRFAACVKDPSRDPETVSAADIVRLLGEGDAQLRRNANLLFNGREALRYGGVDLTAQQLNEMLSAIASKLGVK